MYIFYVFFVFLFLYFVILFFCKRPKIVDKFYLSMNFGIGFGQNSISNYWI